MMAVGHNAQFEDLTPAELSQLQVKGAGSFEIRDFIEYRRIRNERNTGRKNLESYRRS